MKESAYQIFEKKNIMLNGNEEVGGEWNDWLTQHNTKPLGYMYELTI